MNTQSFPSILSFLNILNILNNQIIVLEKSLIP